MRYTARLRGIFSLVVSSQGQKLSRVACNRDREAQMTYWWESDQSERYWVEITDREDLGADLKCPPRNEAGNEYWSYSLVHEIAPRVK